MTWQMKPRPGQIAGGLPITEGPGLPGGDSCGLTEEQIRAVVVEFYKRTLLDDRLGPVFNHHIQDWDAHLNRMTDFWSSAILHTGRFSGRPVESHRLIDGLSSEHFDRWLQLFEGTVRELCPPTHAEAFLVRAERMRVGMTKALDIS